MKKIAFLIMMSLCFVLLSGEWSSNPAQNLKLTNSTYEEVIPKVVYGPTGDVWVSWFSNEAGNYNVRVQRYNFNGVPQFANEGLLVSNNTQMSWLTDWDMKVDSQNNAVVAFLDVRNVSQDIFVYKISPTGEFLWGANGIGVSQDATEDYTPTLGITDADNVIVSWMAGSDLKVQKILSNGTVVLATPLLFHETGFSFTWGQILPQANDTFILKYFKDSGPVYAVLRYVYAQKYDSSVNPVWANPTIITNQGGISAWTQVFSNDSDGNGGFVMCWYEDRDFDQMRNIYLQYVLADGTVAFTPNGIQPTISTSTQHFYPVIAFNQQTEEIWVAWTETDGDQNNRCLRVQKINHMGVSMLGDTGISILPMSMQSPLMTNAKVVNNEFIGIYSDTSMKAFKLNSSGEFVWENDFVTLTSTTGNIVHDETTRFFNNQLIAAWEDSRNSTNQIYLQNLHTDGTLGVQQNPTGITGTVTLNGGSGAVTNVVITVGSQTASPTANGQYTLEIPAGTYTVTATLAGYETVTIQNVVIVENNMTQQNITLNFITANQDNTVEILKKSFKAYPNPFNPSTTIHYTLPVSSEINITFYNVKGQKIRTLTEGMATAGTHQVNWNGQDQKGQSVSSGLYYCVLKTNNVTITTKMMLIK